jgi:hypothetical protein
MLVSIHKPLPSKGVKILKNYMKIKTAMYNVKTCWETWGYQNQRHMGKLITDKYTNTGGGNQWNDVSVPV